MFLGFSLFEKQYQTFLKIDTVIDPKVSPLKIIMELSKPGSQKNCLKQLTRKTKNGFKIMRRLSLAHLLLIYSQRFYELVEKFIDLPLESSNEWLNQKFICPYYHFLKKIVSSTELYNQCKSVFIGNFCFEKTFYIYNLLKELFQIVTKMPLLGRYFKESNQQVTTGFIETLAVQAYKLYMPWKNGLNDLITNHKHYLSSKSDQKLAKAILEQCLPILNEEMKKLFLDKYFYPYGKGIIIKLFRIEEQPENSGKVIKAIIQDHKDTERREAKQELQKTLFPADGIFNRQYFEQTLMVPEKNEYEEMCLDDDEIERGVTSPIKFEDSILNCKDPKETSDHLEMSQDV